MTENLLNDGASNMGLNRFKVALNKVVENVKQAYEKEQSSKVDLYQSVKTIIRNRKTDKNDLDGDSDSNEESEEAQSMEKEIEVTGRLLEVGIQQHSFFATLVHCISGEC